MSGELYRPKDGKEREAFTAAWCGRCTLKRGCERPQRAELYEITSQIYPRAWVRDYQGAGMCRAFRERQARRPVLKGPPAQMSFEFLPRISVVTSVDHGRVTTADQQRLEDVANDHGVVWRPSQAWNGDGFEPIQVADLGDLTLVRYRSGVVRLTCVYQDGCGYGSGCYGAGMLRRALQRLARGEPSQRDRRPTRAA